MGDGGSTLGSIDHLHSLRVRVGVGVRIRIGVWVLFGVEGGVEGGVEVRVGLGV